MNALDGFGTFNLVPHMVSIAIAYLLALPIGWNRERAERSAGLRTFPLVAVACCGLIQACETLVANEPEALARIVEGLITGMGFIGGGAILHKDDRVQGTATAAALWGTGAIGIAVGVGSLDVAVMLAVVTALTLYFISPLKRELNRERDGDERNGDIA
jgi:putative Mg2+ transporter-C (MgtC) family protein